MKRRNRDPNRHDLTRHHRKPRSIGGNNSDENISMIPKNQHQAWHCCFSNMTAPTICAIINEKYLDTRYHLICIDVRHYEKVRNYISQLT